MQTQIQRDAECIVAFWADDGSIKLAFVTRAQAKELQARADAKRQEVTIWGSLTDEGVLPIGRYYDVTNLRERIDDRVKVMAARRRVIEPLAQSGADRTTIEQAWNRHINDQYLKVQEALLRSEGSRSISFC